MNEKNFQYHTSPLNGYTLFPNACINDEDLGLTAKALLCWMMSRPDNWHFSNAGMNAVFNKGRYRDGRDKIETAVKQLEDVGYLKIIKSKKINSTFASFYHIYDHRMTQEEKAALELETFGKTLLEKEAFNYGNNVIKIEDQQEIKINEYAIKATDAASGVSEHTSLGNEQIECLNKSICDTQEVPKEQPQVGIDKADTVVVENTCVSKTAGHVQCRFSAAENQQQNNKDNHYKNEKKINLKNPSHPKQTEHHNLSKSGETKTEPIKKDAQKGQAGVGMACLDNESRDVLRSLITQSVNRHFSFGYELEAKMLKDCLNRGYSYDQIMHGYSKYQTRYRDLHPDTTRYAMRLSNWLSERGDGINQDVGAPKVHRLESVAPKGYVQKAERELFDELAERDPVFKKMRETLLPRSFYDEFKQAMLVHDNEKVSFMSLQMREAEERLREYFNKSTIASQLDLARAC